MPNNLRDYAEARLLRQTEPKIGDIRRAQEIGRGGHSRYIWHACQKCGKERWVLLFSAGKQKCLVCKDCCCHAHNMKRGKEHWNWRGGRTKQSNGYFLIKLQPDDFFYPSRNRQGYVFEHRLVVAKALGRCLHSWEIIHHKGNKYPVGSIENKQDNRYPKNLQLVMEGQHNQISILERKMELQAQRITLLEAEIVSLRRQLEQMVMERVR